MLALTRTDIEQLVIPDWKSRFEKTLFKIKSEYPGNNCDLLGRQLIVALKLKTGVSSMKKGVLFQVVGKMTSSNILSLYIMQPHANTEVFEMDLSVFDALFIKRKNEEWK